MHTCRAAALLLAIGTVLAATGCVESWQQARFERDLELTFLLPAQAGVSADTENGSIDLREVPREDVLVRAHIRAVTQERADAVQVVAGAASGEWLEIGAEWPTPRHGNEGVSFEIEAPGDRRVRAASANGSIVVEGFAGGAELSTSNGAITADGHEGPVWAETANGDVSLVGVQGPVRADTSNGSVHVELADGAGGPVTLATSNGGVTLVVGPAFSGRIDAGTSNGTVRVSDGSEAGLVRLLRERRSSKLVQIGSAEDLSTIGTSNGSIQITVRE